MRSYKDMHVYARSYEAAKEIYALTKTLPKEEQYGLTSQMKRAATSIPLNIAEGYGKQSGTRELLRFLQMARGSCAEMEVLLSFVKDFGYIKPEEYEAKSKQYEEIGKMLTGVMKGLEQHG